MALKFLNKKGWHTGSLRNIENVWKAEQKHDAEQKKLEELRKQIHEERERSEFRALQEQAGLVPYVSFSFLFASIRVRVSFHFILKSDFRFVYPWLQEAGEVGVSLRFRFSSWESQRLRWFQSPWSLPQVRRWTFLIYYRSLQGTPFFSNNNFPNLWYGSFGDWIYLFIYFSFFKKK